jgi:hypothetical protein
MVWVCLTREAVVDLCGINHVSQGEGRISKAPEEPAKIELSAASLSRTFAEQSHFVVRRDGYHYQTSQISLSLVMCAMPNQGNGYLSHSPIQGGGSQLLLLPETTAQPKLAAMQ